MGRNVNLEGCKSVRYLEWRSHRAALSRPWMEGQVWSSCSSYSFANIAHTRTHTNTQVSQQDGQRSTKTFLLNSDSTSSRKLTWVSLKRSRTLVARDEGRVFLSETQIALRMQCVSLSSLIFGLITASPVKNKWAFHLWSCNDWCVVVV